MAAYANRRLTTGEIALALPVFGGSIDYRRVRLWQSPLRVFGAVAPFRHVVIFGAWRAPVDFVETTAHEQGWFIHELAHIWQAAQGVLLPLAKLRALRPADYCFVLSEGRALSTYNIEAQAEIARYAFHALRGAPLPGANADAVIAVWRAALRQAVP